MQAVERSTSPQSAGMHTCARCSHLLHAHGAHVRACQPYSENDLATASGIEASCPALLCTVHRSSQSWRLSKGSTLQRSASCALHSGQATARQQQRHKCGETDSQHQQAGQQSAKRLLLCAWQFLANRSLLQHSVLVNLVSEDLGCCCSTLTLQCTVGCMCCRTANGAPVAPSRAIPTATLATITPSRRTMPMDQKTAVVVANTTSLRRPNQNLHHHLLLPHTMPPHLHRLLPAHTPAKTSMMMLTTR